MSRIYFQPTAEGVDCLIYEDDGQLLARHEMTAWGAKIRCGDFSAAVDEALWTEEMRAVVAIVEAPL